MTSFAQLGELAAARGLTLSPETIQELAAFHAALERANQTTNLTRITGEADFVERLADVLWPSVVALAAAEQPLARPW